MEAEVAMRDLAANILRIIRGAGAPYELRRQMARLDQAMNDHWEAARQWPYSEIAGAVYLHEKPEAWERYDEHGQAEWYARQRIKSGALRAVAGEILGQQLQASHGETEMHSGMREWDRLCEEERKRWQQRETTLAKRAVRKRKPAKKAKPPPIK